MTKLLRVLLPSILLLGVATAATAQVSGGPCSDDTCVQNVYVDPGWDQLGTGANVNSCNAYKQFGNTCIDCLVPLQPAPGQSTAGMCKQVEYSASCTCDTAKCSARQSGAVSGSCTYHQ
jgi:hypothetical protein